MVPARVTKLLACLKLCIGMMPGTTGISMPRGADAVEVAEIEVVIEEHLGDGARRAGVDLGLQRIDVGIERRRSRDASPDRRRPMTSISG